MKYSGFTMLCSFLLYSKVIQLCMYTFLFKLSFLWWCIIGYWTNSLCYAEIDPVVYPFYTSANPDLPLHTRLPLGHHPSMLYVLHTRFIYFGCAESLPRGLFSSCEWRLPAPCYHGLLVAVASLLSKGFSSWGVWSQSLCHMGLFASQPVGSSWTRDRTLVQSCIGRWLLNQWATREVLLHSWALSNLQLQEDNMYFQW